MAGGTPVQAHRYSWGELKQLWIRNGGDPAKADIAAAIALAESAGNSNEVGQNTNGTEDRGLWQINSVHGAQSTTDVTGNTRAAIAISKNGTDWTPWVTFNKGTYKKFLGGKNDPRTNDVSGVLAAPFDAAGKVFDAFSSIPDALGAIAKAIGFIFSTRFLYITGGGILLIVALVMIMQKTGAAKHIPIPKV